MYLYLLDSGTYGSSLFAFYPPSGESRGQSSFGEAPELGEGGRRLAYVFQIFRCFISSPLWTPYVYGSTS